MRLFLIQLPSEFYLVRATNAQYAEDLLLGKYPHLSAYERAVSEVTTEGEPALVLEGLVR